MTLGSTRLTRVIEMAFQDLVAAAQTHFPDLQVKYKDQSTFMKFLGTLLFFNPSFMTNYITTIGSTVYYPNEADVLGNPINSSIILMHELVHIYDSHRLGRLLFSFLYLTPQILALLCLPLFLVSWKLALPLTLFFLLPLPSYFRMHFERRGYFTTLYVMNALNKKYQLNVQLEDSKDYYISQFTSSAYYFMWTFKSSLQAQFEDAINKINSGGRPFEDPVFDIIDNLIASV